ncbi:hypothetical protein ACEPAF_7398 [Sanghuangporus sanghuang]
MDIQFNNTVRVLAVGDEQSLIRYCEESGTIESILGFRHSFDIGDSILFVRFERLSSIYDLKKRARTAKLGGRSVLVETLADSSILQEQCKKLCNSSVASPLSPTLLSGSLRTPLGKENRRLTTSTRPMSVPINRSLPAGKLLLSSHGLGSGLHRSGPLRRLNFHDLAASKSFGPNSTSTDESTVSTLAGLPSPLAKSPTVLRASIRSNSFHTPRTSAFSPPNLRSSTTRVAQSPLLRRTLSLPKRPGSARAHNNVDTSGKLLPQSNFSFTSELDRLKTELMEAREKYTRSLEKVQNHIELMERRYRARQVLEEL